MPQVHWAGQNDGSVTALGAFNDSVYQTIVALHAGAVKGGMYGTPPSLTDLVLDGNLENTTDFRQVYASLIEDWMGADSAKVLGRKFKTMNMFRA